MKPTVAEQLDYDRRACVDREDGLEDPVWRLANLYRCMNSSGQDVPFTPTPEQESVIIAIFIRGWRRLLIPKARQLGMSLLLCLIATDGVIFKDGYAVSWIDKKGPDAEKKLKEKVLFAWDRLDPAIRATLKETKRNTSDLGLRLASDPAAPESTFTAGIGFRGGTVQMMVISEWGWVQVFDRMRSAEIKSGALPAVELAEDGLCVVETTWEGGLDGELGPLVKEAQETPPDQQGPKSWRILFFGWHTNPAYEQDHGYIDAISAKYFAECEAKGLRLSERKKFWYAEKRRTMPRVKAEYPSFPEECWATVVEGAIYGAEMVAARDEGRIIPFRHDHRYPVHTFWDLGMPINTVCWYAQVTPTEIRVIDVDMELDITLEARAAKMRAKGYDFGFHYIPWEAEMDHTTGSTRARMIAALGQNVRVVQKVARVENRIGMMRLQLPRCVFHAERCALGIEHLQRYRYERQTSSGTIKDAPCHDKYSHAADALGQMAQAINEGIVPNGGSVGGMETKAGPPVVRKAGHWA